MLRRTVSIGLDEGLILAIRHRIPADMEFGGVDGVGRRFALQGVLAPRHDAAHLKLASRDVDELEGDGASDGEDRGGGWGRPGLGRLRLNETGVLAGVVLFEFGEEFGEEEVILAVGDELIDHIIVAVARTEAPNDHP
jgi:hypothetical protein